MSLHGVDGIQSRPLGGARSLALALPYLGIGIGVYLLSQAWLAVAIYHLGMVAYLFLYRADLSRATGGWSLETGLGLLLFGAAGGGLLLLFWPLLGLEEELAFQLPYLGMTGGSWVAFLVYFSLINPVLEELFWRGLLAGRSRRLERGDLLFALYHVLVLRVFLDWTWVLLALASLLAAAWLWRQIMWKHGGLAMPILSHLAAGVSVSLVLWLRGTP